MFNGRIVHLDLKGAPPRPEYLIHAFIPMLKRFGATGLLIEWEDMFPYLGVLSEVRCEYAYTPQNVAEILEAAAREDISVVPLVQTFGHLEWLLKNQSFQDIREAKEYPQVVCPSNPRTYSVLFEMIDQVVARHPNADAIHIGADEAFTIGACTRCRAIISNRLGNSVEAFVLQHIAKVSRYVKEKHGLKVFIWHDMLQNMEPTLLRQYLMDELVEPVIWGYVPHLSQSSYFPEGLFERFREVFPKLWVASAYKGANGPDQSFLNISRYLENHLSWIELALEKFTEETRFHTGRLEGIVLTGWQRFDHFSVLCELLPVATPSLAIDLLTIAEGCFTPAAVIPMARRLLDFRPQGGPTSATVVGVSGDLDGCNSLGGSSWGAAAYPDPSSPGDLATPNSVDLEQSTVGLSSYSWMNCDFPGSPIYRAVEELRILLQKVKEMFENPEILGWLSEYNRVQVYAHPSIAKRWYNTTTSVLNELVSLGVLLRAELSRVYFGETVDEWLFQNVQTHLDKMRRFRESLIPIFQTDEFPKRPLRRLRLDV